MTVREAFDKYKVEVVQFGNQSSKTEEHHTVAMNCLLSFLGQDRSIYELDFNTVRKWKLCMESNKLSPMTIRGYLIKLRVVLKHAQKNGIDCLDPDLIKLPKKVDQKIHFLTKEDVAILIDSTSSLQAKTIISLLYASGIRVSELCSLDRNDIRPDNSFTVIGKGNKARLCFLDARTASLLKVLLKSRSDSNPALFVSRISKKRITPGNVQEIFKHIRKKNGLIETISPHWLRHSYATNLMQNNCHIYTVQRLLGHASIDTTARYLHITDNSLKDEYLKHHSV